MKCDTLESDGTQLREQWAPIKYMEKFWLKLQTYGTHMIYQINRNAFLKDYFIRTVAGILEVPV